MFDLSNNQTHWTTVYLHSSVTETNTAYVRRSIWLSHHIWGWLFEKPLKCVGIKLKPAPRLSKLDFFQECISHAINTTEMFKHIITEEGRSRAFSDIPGEMHLRADPKITSCFAFESGKEALSPSEYMVLRIKKNHIFFYIFTIYQADFGGILSRSVNTL